MKATRFLTAAVLTASAASAPGLAGPTKVTLQIDDPASLYCLERGGALETETTSGKSTAFCSFGARRCEAQALLSGLCAYEGVLDDPFTYCALRHDSEIVPASQTGGAFPAVLVEAMLDQGLLSKTMPPEIRQNSEWRCMDGFVWACTVGANLPCSQKADTNGTPSAAISDFCRSEPEANTVPAYVTGRATVYSWECGGGTPRISKQVYAVDPQGYPAELWNRVEKSAE